MRLPLRAAVTAPAWWAGYVLLTLPPSPPEVVVGSVVAVITAGVAGVVARVSPTAGAAPPGRMRDLAALPWRVVWGFARVVVAGLAPGPVRGTAHDDRSTGTGAAARAWAGWAGSLAPDEIVTGFPDGRTVTRHALPGGPG